MIAQIKMSSINTFAYHKDRFRYESKLTLIQPVNNPWRFNKMDQSLRKLPFPICVLALTIHFFIAAFPAVAQEHLVLLRRPVGRLPHRAPAQGPAVRGDAEVLDQRGGERLDSVEPPITVR